MVGRLATLALASLLLAAPAGPTWAGELIVRLSGFDEIKGVVLAGLFTSAEDHEAGNRLRGQSADVEGKTVTLVFSDLDPGTYGLTVFHDVNENGELDRSFVGMPTEPYGFSNGARGRFGPPSFEEFAFELSDDMLVIAVEVD